MNKYISLMMILGFVAGCSPADDSQKSGAQEPEVTAPQKAGDSQLTPAQVKEKVDEDDVMDVVPG